MESTYTHAPFEAIDTDTNPLRFKPITLADLPAINALLQRGGSRTCDYTIGGIYMWIDFFHYEYCIWRDTLFIKGVCEDSRSTAAFSMPIGALPVEEAIRCVARYCDATDTPLCFSAIPEDKVDYFMITDVARISELTDWADYLYDAPTLATLSGKRMAKKRNHVNRFIADNPGYSFSPLTSADIPDVTDAYRRMLAVDTPEGDSGANERDNTIGVLDNWDSYPFEGAVLRDGTGRIVAFTIGEVIGDTLYVHIEKMDHSVAGAGETVNRLFAAAMLDKHHICFINREENCGDPGLRAAKESYHPLMRLRKYNIAF